MSAESTGFLFPNDAHITWSLMIVIYPYVTGVVAGAFIVSSLYHVFGHAELRPVARLAMVASLGFLMVATLPLLCHLGHPERAFNIMLTPHFTSAMAAFGLIYGFYMILLLVEVWLSCRGEIILLAARSRGLKRWVLCALALGTYDVSEEALRLDHRAVGVLAAIGIPSACILHGYVGFMFGSVKANYWWSTPLMPVIFLMSAVTSGMAMVIIIYQVTSKMSGRRIDSLCVQSLARWLWLFTLMTVTLEMLEIVIMSYENNEMWAKVVSPLLSTKLTFSFFGVQLVFGSLIPILLLGVVVLMKRYLTAPLTNTISLVASLILLVQVFAMRWNVVIGGQIFSKSMRGFRESYQPELFGREGIVVAVLILMTPFIFMTIFNRFIPLYQDDSEESASVHH